MENEDKPAFLEGLYKKIDPINKALDFSDHINWRDPIGWDSLGQRFGEETVGKKWKEGQMQDIWNAVPESWRPNIAKSAMSTAQSIGTAWEGARTVDNWFDPIDVAGAGTARLIEAAALPFEGAAQLISKGTGLDIELARIATDFIPIGAVAKRASSFKKSTALANKLKTLDATTAKKVVNFADNIEPSLDPLKKYDLLVNEFPQISLAEESGFLHRIKNKLDEGDGYSYRKGRPLKNPIWDNLPEKTQKQFIDAGIDSDNAKFFIENWTREVGATVEGFPFTDRTFEFMKGELLPQILEDLKGIDLSDGLQLDHIAQLKAMTPFYKGRNLKQAQVVRRILIKEGVFGGHNPKNLKYLPTDVHTVKTKFWEQQVGKDGSKFFKGRPMRTYADIEKAAKEMKNFINRSNDIVEKVSAQYKFMRKKNITADELDKILKKVDLNHGTYNLKEVRALIKEIEADKLAKSKKGLDDAKKAAEAVEFKEKKTFLPYEIEDVDPADIPKKPRTKKKKSTLEKMADKEFLKEHERIKKLEGQQELDLD
jgi:hypothetical protein